MARPLYIIVAQDYMLDRETGFLSLHKIVDEITLFPGSKESLAQDVKAGAQPWVQLSVVAAWERDTGDEDASFECEMIVQRPGNKPETVRHDEFSFTRRQHRFILAIRGQPVKQSGELTVCSRIRKQADGGEWLEQSRAIRVVLRESPSS